MNSAKPVSLLFIIVAAIIMSFNASSVVPPSDPYCDVDYDNACIPGYEEGGKCYYGGVDCEYVTGTKNRGECDYQEVTPMSSINCPTKCGGSDGNILKNNAVKVCTPSGPTCEYSTRDCDDTDLRKVFERCKQDGSDIGIFRIEKREQSCFSGFSGTRCKYDDYTDTGNEDEKSTPKCDKNTTCSDECSLSSSDQYPRCNGNDRVTCIEGKDGCLNEIKTSCAPGTCEIQSGTGVAVCDYPDSCTNDCDPNGIYCDGNVETVCLELDGDGCYELAAENDCSTNVNKTKCVEPGLQRTECVEPSEPSTPDCTSDSECGAPSDGSCTYDSVCDRTDTYKTYEGVCNSGSCQVNTANNQCSRTVYPTADFTYSQQGEEIKFDASSSAGNVDSITDYSWNFGDGTTASGETVYHEYGNEGAFTVTLTVSDSCSYTDVDSESFKWVRFEGPEINRAEVNTLAAEKRWELFKDTSATNTCMYKDTRMTQSDEKDVGASNSNLENGGHSEDKEVCADLDGGVGMEWADQDNFSVTKRLRPPSIPKPSSWVTNPDANADAFTGVKSEYKGSGIALEDDCEGECSDEGGSISATEPFQAPFSEGVKEDDNNNGGSVVLPYVHNRVQAGGSTGHGSSNDQDIEGVSLRSSPLQNSQIDPEDDEWALTRSLNRSIDNYGNMYDPGSCYPTSSGISKSNAVYANSYAENSGGDGNWANPDNTVNSAKRGGISCDITDNDWGYGYNTGGSNLNVHRGDARQYGYDTTDKHAVSGPVAFDDGQKPLGENQDDLKQYPDACGDDQNEFLIREQYSSYGGGEIYPNLTDRDNIYVCADRITDCAYNGAVYSEGQTLDISSQTSHNQEMGEQLPDEEICLDLNKSTPGGAWYDKDQEFTVEHRIKGLNNNPAYDGSEVWSAVEKFSDHDFDRNKYHSRYNSTDWRNQTTKYDRTDLAYFNRTGGYYSPPSHRTNVRGQQKRYYSPEGYATEDDCGPLLSKSSTGPCGDVGDDTQNKSWFSAGNFTGMAP